jgi:UDP-N-acetylglucosamine--N-acetylmuramyl-(pentapeptide) pyrophosphoryl-undecaprenol N-acetylglucosamine transferase
MRVILAGGGTGGHVIPALAIANELKNSFGAKCLFVGTARGIENRLVPAAGYPLRLVRIGALNRVSFATRLKTMFDLPRAIWDAADMLNLYAPDVVIGVGGYASGPAMLAAVVKHIPTLAFEPNVVPGFANRVVARFVSAAAVHFEETAKYFRHAEVTGVPVRHAFFEIPPKRGGTPTLLVFGGSQGAHSINQAMIRCLPVLQREAPGIYIIHQTGERDYNDALAAYGKLASAAPFPSAGFTYEVFKFIEDMPAAFARADLVVCRSGASTVAEIAAAGKPAVFVPFPRAADDHQRVNAEALARHGAAVVVEESKLEGVWLAETIAALLGDSARLQHMSHAARELAHPNAARDIATMAARLSGIEEPVSDSQRYTSISTKDIKYAYQEKFPVGTGVRIVHRDVLEDFMRTWKFHNKLRPEQLEYAGDAGKIKSVGFYHGGDVLYEIENIPGIWHERCLQADVRIT